MPHKSRIWCVHPCHDKVLPDGKKRFWKTGSNPTHPKGKRSINEELAEYINNHNESILNGNSERLSEGDYLCSTCFEKEENCWMIDHSVIMQIDDEQESCDYKKVDSGPDYKQDSPMDDDCARHELLDVQKQLNQVFEFVNVKKVNDFRKTNQVSNAVDETYFTLLKWSNTLAPSSRRNVEPETFNTLGLSMDDAVWILRHLRESFNISDNYEQQRLMTMLPSDWGRDRIANWFDGSKHQARQSIQLRTTSGVLSFPEDRRGNKSLDSQVELAVHNFYISDEISRETSNKKQIIHPPPSRIPVPLRFLHLTIGETYEQFKLEYPNVEMNRS
ncbi:unnamed protein product, partial [Rotaria sp. Silwood2]